MFREKITKDVSGKITKTVSEKNNKNGVGKK